MDMHPEAAHPLVARLDRYVTLTEAERKALRALTTERVAIKPGRTLVVEARQSDSMFILHTGWLHTSTVLKGGARQILRIHQPGDLVNTSCLAWSRVVATVTAVTEAEVWPVPRDRLTGLFSRHQRLAGLLYGLSIAENVALSDRLKSLGRTDAEARLAALLLDILFRRRVSAPDDANELDLFLTQNDMADTLGLTKVHVNRVLKKMTEDGLIERTGRRVRIPDIAKLIDLSGFVDRHSEVCTDWLP